MLPHVVPSVYHKARQPVHTDKHGQADQRQISFLPPTEPFVCGSGVMLSPAVKPTVRSMSRAFSMVEQQQNTRWLTHREAQRQEEPRIVLPALWQAWNWVVSSKREWAVCCQWMLSGVARWRCWTKRYYNKTSWYIFLTQLLYILYIVANQGEKGCKGATTPPSRHRGSQSRFWLPQLI